MPPGDKEIHKPLAEAFIAVAGCYAQLNPARLHQLKVSISSLAQMRDLTLPLYHGFI
jgi:hypothetical protein